MILNTTIAYILAGARLYANIVATFLKYLRKLGSYNFELLLRVSKKWSFQVNWQWLFDIWKQVGLAVGDIDNIQRHARMDRYVAQVTSSSQNVSLLSILQIQTQIEKSGSFSGHPPLPSLLITEKLYLPSPPSSVQNSQSWSIDATSSHSSVKGSISPTHPQYFYPPAVRGSPETTSTQTLSGFVSEDYCWRAQERLRRRTLDTLLVFQ